MRSELGQRLRNNSNLLSRDMVLQIAMSHQDGERDSNTNPQQKNNFMHI